MVIAFLPNCIGLPSPSGQLAKGAQAAEQAVTAARARPLRRALAQREPGALLPFALGGTGRALRQDASDIAGMGDTFERGHYEVSNDPGKTVHEGDRIAKEGGRGLGKEGLHGRGLQVV